MSLLLGYQQCNQGFIATDLLNSANGTEMEKLMPTKDPSFFVSLTGRVNILWLQEMGNHISKLDYLNGRVGEYITVDTKKRHANIELRRREQVTTVFLFEYPLGIMTVDATDSQIYFGELNPDGPKPLTPLGIGNMVSLGCCDIEHVVNLFKSELDKKQNFSPQIILSSMEETVLSIGRQIPDSVRGAATYSITAGNIERRSYHPI